MEHGKPEHIFASPFWHIRDDMPQGALKWALNYKKTHPMAQRRSNRGGYQSMPTHNFDEFEYKSYIIAVLRFLPKFTLQNWWVNVNGKGDFNMAHTHSGSDLSLVWYLTDNNNSFRILNPQHHVRNNINRAFSGYASYGFNYELVKPVDCKEGDIIIFPSDLEHYVEPHELRKERVTVSLNLKFN